jgi:hypothetical protein
MHGGSCLQSQPLRRQKDRKFKASSGKVNERDPTSKAKYKQKYGGHSDIAQVVECLPGPWVRSLVPQKKKGGRNARVEVI